MSKKILSLLFGYAFIAASEGLLNPNLLKAPCSMLAKDYKNFLVYQVRNYAFPNNQESFTYYCTSLSPLGQALENYGRFELKDFPSNLPQLSPIDFLTVVRAWEFERDRIEEFLSTAKPLASISSSSVPHAISTVSPLEKAGKWGKLLARWAFFIVLLYLILRKIWALFRKV